MADTKEVKNPVRVQVSNITDVNTKVVSVGKEVERIYNLLNGNDYKRVFNTLSSQNRSIQGNVASIERLLRDINTSLRSQSRISGSATNQSQTTINASTIADRDSKEETRRWRDDVYSIIEDIQDAIKNNPSSKNIEKGLDDLREITEKSSRNSNQDKTITASEETSRQRAIESIEDKVSKSNALLSSATKILQGLSGEFTRSIREVFNRWDTQIATLKEQGMGSWAGAELNRMTSRTMEAAEATLGYNISIAKAIKATNSLIEAGQNPKYISENNKQLIMGLSSVGINFNKNTIRALSQSIVDAGRVKPLATQFARITNPNTDNAYDKGEVSQFVDSDAFKKARSAAANNGVDITEFQDRWVQAVMRAQERGATAQAAMEMALLETQAAFGAPIVAGTGKAQQYIAMANMAGTYNGDLSKLTESYAAAMDKMQYDKGLRSRYAQVNASLAASGDFTFLENVMDNSGRRRHIATEKEVEEGQFEGYIPRAAKWIANNPLSQTIGAASQQITGSSTTFTNIGSSVVSGLTTEAGKLLFQSITNTNYLSKIARNTESFSKTATSIESSTTALKKGSAEQLKNGNGMLKGMSKAAKALGALGVVATVADLGITAYEGYKAHEFYSNQSDIARMEADKVYAREQELLSRYQKALMQGGAKNTEQTKKMLDDATKQTNDAIAEIVKNEKEATKEGVIKPVAKGALSVAGGLGGAAIGAKIGAAAGTVVPGIGNVIGFALGGAGGYFFGDKLVDWLYNTDATKEDIAEKRQKQSVAGHFERGGIVDKNSIVEVAENDKAEAVIPLENRNDAQRVMEEAATNPNTDKSIAESLSIASESIADKSVPKEEEPVKPSSTIADAIIQYAKSVLGVPYKSNHSYMKHPEKGMVCNQLVEYAYKKAGIDLPSTSVHYHRLSGKWGFTEDPQPGYAIFSNYIVDNPKYKPPISDYGHMGIVGYGNERIHAKYNGQVVLDPNYVKSLSYEKGSEWKRAGKKPYIFGFLKGVDYGNGVQPVDIATIMDTSPVVADIDTEKEPESPAEILQKSIQEPTSNRRRRRDYSEGSTARRRRIRSGGERKSFDELKADQSIAQDYARSINGLEINQDVLSDDVLKALINIPAKVYGSPYKDYIASNNPMGLYDPEGTLNEYDSLEAGILDYTSNVELALNKIAGKSFKKQMEDLRRFSFIDPRSYSYILRSNQDKLVDSLDSLNRSVQENTRERRRVNTPSVPTGVIPGRRY